MPLPLTAVALLAAIQGLSEALPISRGAHDVAAWIWLEPGRDGPLLESTLHLGTALAFFVAARKSLVAVAGEGLRAVARPSLLRDSPKAHDAAVLAIAASISLALRAVLSPWIESWANAPFAVGFGLVLTGLLVGTLVLVSPGEADSPPLALAPMLGAGHALAGLPGGSDMAAALVLCIWMGQKQRMALDLALMLSGTTILATFVFGIMARPEATTLGLFPTLLGLVTAFLGATVGLTMLRFLLERRAVSLLALWIFPVAFATIAYARYEAAGASNTSRPESRIRVTHA